MAEGGISFFQSQVPDKWEPEKPKEEPNEVELLRQKIEAMEQERNKSASEAHRKISELTNQTSLLNQTIQDLMSQRIQPPAATPEKKDITDWDAEWRRQFNPQAQPNPETKAGEEVKPEEIAQVVRQEFGKMYQEGEEAKIAYQEQEAALIEKFRTEEKELHPYAEEVKQIWKTVAMANPQLPLEHRYALVVDTAKRTLLKNGKPPAAPSGNGGGGGQVQHPSRVAAGEGLQELNFTGNFGADLQAERNREQARFDKMSQGIAMRRAQQAQRLGLNIPS